MTSLVPTYTFHGYPVRRLSYRGALAYIAREIGAAIGYPKEGKRFVSQITSEWSQEIKEGVHWHRVTGDELRNIKAQAESARAEQGPVGGPRSGSAPPQGPSAGPCSQGLGPPAGPSRAEAEEQGPVAGPCKALSLAFAHDVVLLTEEGLNLALLRCGGTRPLAVEFRAWLAHDVVPQIARTGKYDPAPVPLPRPAPLPRPGPAIAALRRVVDHAILSGRLDVAAELLLAYQKLAAAPGVPLLPPPARLRASNRLLTRLIQRRALKGGPRLAVLFQQRVWRPSEKAVLGLLLDLGATERRVELSYVDVAERLDIHRATAVGALNVLKKAGVVTGGGGRRGRDPAPNGYVVDPEALAAWTDKERPDTWSEAEKAADPMSLGVERSAP